MISENFGEALVMNKRESMKSFGRLAVVAGLIMVVIGTINVAPANGQEVRSLKTLIVYYSLTGNTKAVCEALQKEIGCDIIEIKDLKSREVFPYP